MTERLRILQVGTGATAIPPVGAYGIERAIHTLSTALQELGHQVALIDVGSPARPPVPYQIIPIGVAPWEEKDSLLSRAPRVLLFSMLAARKVRQLLKSGAFDLVHCHFQFPGGLVVPGVGRSKTPVVYSVHNFVWSDLAVYRKLYREALPRMNVRCWLWLEMERRAIRSADAVTCQTDPVARNVAAELQLQAEKVDVIPHGLGDDWFELEVEETPDVPWVGPEEPVVLNVARIAPVKNQKVLAQATALVTAAVPSVRFIFVGPQSDAGYAQEVREILSRSGAEDRVTFLSNVPEQDLRNLYRRSDLFALPSLAESSPASLLEAMASGTPVVGSDIDTLQWLIPDGCGVVLPPRDHHAWADAIIGLLENEKKRKAMAAKAWRHAYESHRWAAIAGRFVELYRRVRSTCPC